MVYTWQKQTRIGENSQWIKLKSGENPQKINISLWQKPENMSFPRPISVCDGTILNFTREIVAGLSEAALVFKDQKEYTSKLVQSAENLYKLARNLGPLKETIDMYINWRLWWTD